MKLRLALFFCMITLVTVSFAQPGGGPGGGGDPGHGQPVPISGIEILLAAGGLLGARKLLNKTFSKKSNL